MTASADRLKPPRNRSGLGVRQNHVNGRETNTGGELSGSPSASLGHHTRWGVTPGAGFSISFPRRVVKAHPMTPAPRNPGEGVAAPHR